MNPAKRKKLYRLGLAEEKKAAVAEVKPAPEPTKEPELLNQILLCKASVNFNIKMWAEDRGKGCLGKLEFQNIIKEYELLPWMVEAVENQKLKYY